MLAFNRILMYHDCAALVPSNTSPMRHDRNAGAFDLGSAHAAAASSQHCVIANCMLRCCTVLS